MLRAGFRTILCCLLTGLCPGLRLLAVDMHADDHSIGHDEHHADHDHFHDDHHVPHHNHDSNGAPIPVSLDQVNLATQRSGPALFGPPGPAPLFLMAALPAADGDAGSTETAERSPETRFAIPARPRPGDILRLRI